MVGIWEIGILLAGIGLLILCVFTAVTIRDFGVLAKRLDKVIDANEEEIKMISKSTVGIAGSLESISSRVDKIFSVLTAFEQLKSVFKRNKMSSEDKTEEMVEDLTEDSYNEDHKKHEKFDKSEDDNYKAE